MTEKIIPNCSECPVIKRATDLQRRLETGTLAAQAAILNAELNYDFHWLVYDVESSGLAEELRQAGDTYGHIARFGSAHAKDLSRTSDNAMYICGKGPRRGIRVADGFVIPFPGAPNQCQSSLGSSCISAIRAAEEAFPTSLESVIDPDLSEDDMPN